MATMSSVTTSRPGIMLPTPSRTRLLSQFASKAGSGRSQATGLAATLAGSRNVRTCTVHAFPEDSRVGRVNANPQSLDLSRRLSL
jgi:hypothetical protein